MAYSISDNLNQQQQKAIQHTGSPLLIIAGPGSGKTRVITHRVAWLVLEKQVPPERILAVTFTNRATKEMAQRLEVMLPTGKRRPVVRTFHAFCARLLRREEARNFVDPDYKILDEADRLQMVLDAADRIGISIQRRPARGLARMISHAKNRHITPEEYPNHFDDDLGQFTVEQQAKLYASYEKLIHGCNCLDFDDLLIYAVNLLTSNESARHINKQRFQHLLVDEFQDNNRLQYQLLELLAGDNPNVCVAGDPDQQIYTFRNASSENISDFKAKFIPAVIPLGQNYRSTPEIVANSANLISHNRDREPIQLFTENPAGPETVEHINEDPEAEAEWIAGIIQQKISSGSQSSDFAILYRNNSQSFSMEHSLRQRQIPYRIYGGQPFWSREEIKDTIAYLDIVKHPANLLAWRRTLKTPPKNVGAKTLEKLTAYADRSGANLGQAITSIVSNYPAGTRNPLKIPKRQMDGLTKLSADRETIARLSNQWPPHRLIQHLLEITGLAEHIKADDNPEERWANVEELINFARQYENLPPQEALTELMTSASLDHEQSDAPQSVTLSTIHRPKGTEYPIVFVKGLNEGILPSSRYLDDDQIQEERRICYVAATRAQTELHLSHTRTIPGRDGYPYDADPSRFIEEGKTPAQAAEQADDP